MRQSDVPSGLVHLYGELPSRRSACCRSPVAGVRVGDALPLGKQLPDLRVREVINTHDVQNPIHIKNDNYISAYYQLGVCKMHSFFAVKIVE